MTSSLAVRIKEEDSATGCTAPADLVTYVDSCVEMDGEVLGEFIECNWDQVAGNALGLMHLVLEIQRKFKNLDRKKQVDGTYLTIRGFTSFKKWFASFTGKSERLAYYLLETEKKKNERNAERRTSGKKKGTDSATFISRCGDAKKKLAEIQRQISKATPFKDGEDRDSKLKPLHKQINLSVNEVFNEFLAHISPEGYKVRQGDNGWYLSKKYEDDEPEPPSPEDKKAKRSAAAKKAAATRAANKAAAQPAPAAAAPATTLGECEQ